MTPQTTDDPAINKRRSHINNARGKLEIVEDITPREFISTYEDHLRARGKTKSYLDPELVDALLGEGLARGRVRLVGARRKRRTPEEKPPRWEAAVAIAWDRALPSKDEPAPDGRNDGRCFLLLLTYRSTPDGGDKPVVDANKVLIMEAADFAARHGLTFDTGGWATHGAMRFYRQLFPGPASEEYLNIYERVQWHAAWYDRKRQALKDAAAAHGISQLRFSWHNVRMVGLSLRNWLGRRGPKSEADSENSKPVS